MFPFVDIFGKEISLYTICALLGLFAALFCISRLARKRGLQIEDPLISLLVLIPFALIGGLLLFGLTNLDYFCALAASWDRYGTAGQKVVAVLNGFGGVVFYGGLLGAIAGMAVYCRVAKKPFALYFDMLAVVVPLFHAFGRVGCFLSGCCYGIEFPGGVVFDHATVDSANGVPRFPIQLFEAGFDLLIFFILLRLFWKWSEDCPARTDCSAGVDEIDDLRKVNGGCSASGDGVLGGPDQVDAPCGPDCSKASRGPDHARPPLGSDLAGASLGSVHSGLPLGHGSLLFVYFLLYGVLRFFDEFLRGDAYRGFLGPFSTSQWISLILIAVALGYFLWKWQRRKNSAA